MGNAINPKNIFGPASMGDVLATERSVVNNNATQQLGEMQLTSSLQQSEGVLGNSLKSDTATYVSDINNQTIDNMWVGIAAQAMIMGGVASALGGAYFSSTETFKGMSSYVKAALNPQKMLTLSTSIGFGTASAVAGVAAGKTGDAQEVKTDANLAFTEASNVSKEGSSAESNLSKTNATVASETAKILSANFGAQTVGNNRGRF